MQRVEIHSRVFPLAARLRLPSLLRSFPTCSPTRRQQDRRHIVHQLNWCFQVLSIQHSKYIGRVPIHRQKLWNGMSKSYPAPSIE